MNDDKRDLQELERVLQEIRSPSARRFVTAEKLAVARRSQEAVARKEGLDVKKVREEMQRAIDEGWRRSRGDPEAEAYWKELMGEGEGPLRRRNSSPK